MPFELPPAPTPTDQSLECGRRLDLCHDQVAAYVQRETWACEYVHVESVQIPPGELFETWITGRACDVVPVPEPGLWLALAIGGAWIALSVGLGVTIGPVLNRNGKRYKRPQTHERPEDG